VQASKKAWRTRRKRPKTEADLEKKIANARNKQTEWMTKLNTAARSLKEWHKQERRYTDKLMKMQREQAYRAETAVTRHIELEED